MPKLTTASVSLAVTPTLIQTLLSHYLNRKSLHHQPTAHLSYHEGLHLIRSFLEHASHHTVEEIQAFTSQWVPHPAWVRVKEVTVPDGPLERAAELLAQQLGADGVRRVGGIRWWRWRKPESPLRAEWIEMHADHAARKKRQRAGSDPTGRVMLYVHGGAYYFGSVDEHRYMLQRHARKLKARVFAPRYRLAPQFPFPCGLQDCLAAYLHLLAEHSPSAIVLAGDSAGAGMVLSMLVTMRDRGVPLPAGAVLISPWADLTHSFPSVSAENPLDYIPAAGFHHRPSRAWPPPNEEDLAVLRLCADERRGSDRRAGKTNGDGTKNGDSANGGKAGGKTGDKAGDKAGDKTAADIVRAVKQKEDLEASTATPLASPMAPDVAREVDASRLLNLKINGKDFTVKEQIQMYTTNDMLTHSLISPVMQPSLGGLPPLLIIVGGGEMLRDEQIYLAHKCANPKLYLPPDALLDEAARAQVERYGPTDVQLQVWDSLCHVAPTLSFTRPAKHIFRSIAQFGAWALARAQQTAIDIPADDDISIISSSYSGVGEQRGGDGPAQEHTEAQTPNGSRSDDKIGRAGDPLPAFRDHMIRQRVTRHGVIYDLEPPSELAGCAMPREELGVIRGNIARRWLARRRQWDMRYAREKARVQEKIIADLAAGLFEFGPDERPPPSALAGRRRIEAEVARAKKTRSVGMALWSLWGSKHDEMTMEREERAERAERAGKIGGDDGEGGEGGGSLTRSVSKQRTVVDEHQTQQQHQDEDEDERKHDQQAAIPAVALLNGVFQDGEQDKKRGDKGKQPEVDTNTTQTTQTTQVPPSQDDPSQDHLSPDDLPQGVTGKRVFINDIAMPFSLGKTADTASMMTLLSSADSDRRARPLSVSEHKTGDYTGDYAGGPTPLSPGASVLDRYFTASEGGTPAAEEGREVLSN